ncbi:MAG TPA: hypothetical protein DCS93_17670 [Microscillaceae bacterium]|nr:hypothetical protein [Microscillaceae bacterium]
MKLVYKSNYQEIYYLKKDAELYFQWTPLTLQMEDKDYQQEVLQSLKYLKRYKPQKTLINLKQFAYTIDPDMQTWVKKHFLDMMVQQNLTNVSALVVSDDFFAQKSIEQSYEDTVQENYSRYFDSEAEAKDWLVG